MTLLLGLSRFCRKKSCFYPGGGRISSTLHFNQRHSSLQYWFNSPDNLHASSTIMKQTENILLPKNPDLTKTSHCTSANLRYYLSTLVTIIPKNKIKLIVDYISHSWRSISVQFLPAVVSQSGGKADSAKLCLQLLICIALLDQSLVSRTMCHQQRTMYSLYSTKAQYP